jgi:hypothetical protein
MDIWTQLFLSLNGLSVGTLMLVIQVLLLMKLSNGLLTSWIVNSKGLVHGKRTKRNTIKKEKEVNLQQIMAVQKLWVI